MNSFLYDLKGEITVLNMVVVFLIVAFLLNRYKKRKAAIFLLSISIFIFLLCSTPWFPNYLASRIEKQYLPLGLPVKNADTARVLIHVLGTGYTLDKRLPPNAQLGLVGLGRLAEGIRIHRGIKNSIIVCSGYSSLGLETQAQVTKRAAVVLGVDSNEVETLNTPSTTQEEARDLGRQYPKTSKLIVVTDALHMPRALKLFRKEGFAPIAAPTNFKVNEGPFQESFRWLPSVKNIILMDYLIHEYLGDLKSIIYK